MLKKIFSRTIVSSIAKGFGFLNMGMKANFSSTKKGVFKVVLVRHGESTWNKENLFTGWTDVPLSPKGKV